MGLKTKKLDKLWKSWMSIARKLIKEKLVQSVPAGGESCLTKEQKVCLKGTEGLYRGTLRVFNVWPEEHIVELLMGC